MPCVIHDYARTIASGRVLKRKQIDDVVALVIVAKGDTAELEGEVVVIPPKTWLVRVKGKPHQYFLVPTRFKAELREVFSMG